MGLSWAGRVDEETRGSVETTPVQDIKREAIVGYQKHSKRDLTY